LDRELKGLLNMSCPRIAGNAFAIFPYSPAKIVGIVLMVAHQLVAYGLFILPVCIM
jgi:hypothetical protein